MHVRLQQRILTYSILFLVALLFGKLIFLSNDCKEKLGNNPHKRVTADPWNINEHLIELQVNKVINKIRRTSDHLKPLVSPDVDHNGIPQGEDMFIESPKNHPTQEDWGPHQLALIVPYRDRFEELKEFVPHMHKYLNKKKINHQIFIINQVDQHRFNRASLINVGFLIARKESCDYIAMHDVDLMPLNIDLNYGYPDLGPFHLSAPHLHPKYHYKKFVGGILLVSIEQFEELNGLSNKFWGWGREDDEFYMRIVEKGYKIYRHGKEITTGYETFKHEHGRERKRDYAKLPGQRKAMFERDLFTGLKDVKYTIKKRQELSIDGNPCIVIDVELECDLDLTPWCNLSKKKKE